MRLFVASRYLLAVVAGVALAVAVLRGLGPGLFFHGSCRTHANETAAIATLRNLTSAEEQFRATALADTDGDGEGEYGSFRELSAASFVRGDPKRGRLAPPVMSGAFKSPDAKGVVTRSAYRFAIFLPARDGGWVVADRAGFDTVDPEAAETKWRAYAWPKKYGPGESRTFFADADGRILATDDPTYEGTFPLLADAADADGWIEVN